MDLFNEARLHAIVDHISRKYFQKPFVDKVLFNHRLRTTGGRYIPSKKQIELNPKYFLEMEEREWVGIIKHELVHYHLHIEGKGYKHGDKAFKELLKKTDSPRHCKPLPSQRNKKEHLYICKTCHKKYSRLRKMNVTKYRCGKCGGNIQYVGIREKKSDFNRK